MKISAILLVAVAMLCTGFATGHVNYEYYEGTWNNLPDFDSLTPKHTGLAVNFDIGYRDVDEGFGFRFRALISIAVEGTYTFYTTSDDGSKLLIDDILVVNNDGLHGTTEQAGNVDLAAGEHTIEVTYFEKSGSNVLHVHYKGPDTDMEKRGIADNVLRPVELPATRKACCPLPPDEARGVDPAAVLQWEPPPLVDGPEYDVYFGTDPNLPEQTLVAEGTTPVFDPEGDMAAGTRYYWRVDVYDPNTGGVPKTVRGDVWSFTTRYGLVAMYEFEADPNDSSGNAHHGSFQGDATIVLDARRGNVLSLDGDGDFVALVNPRTADQLGIGGNNPRSMTVWVNTRSFNNGGIFDVGAHSDGQEFSLRTLGSPDQWRIQYWGGAYDIDFTCDSLDKWVHFALVHNGAVTRMYVNGILTAEEPRVLNTSGADVFRIGQYGGDEFDGLIDDFALWDYALPSEEIRRMVLLADFDDDNDVDADDLESMAGNWLASTIVPASIRPIRVLEDFEVYSVPFPPIHMGWFVFLHDSGKYGNPAEGKPYPCTLVTGVPEAPYGGDQVMKVHYEFPVYAPADDWLVLGHYISVEDAGEIDLAKYDEIRFRIKYHADNTDDVVLIFQGADEPPGVIEREAFRFGPVATTDDPADPNQWHEIVIDLRTDEALAWQSPYGGVKDVHNFNGILFSIVNTSGQERTGTLYFDDVRLIDYTPDCDGLPPTDIDGDCVVDKVDFGILADEWMRTGL